MQKSAPAVLEPRTTGALRLSSDEVMAFSETRGSAQNVGQTTGLRAQMGSYGASYLAALLERYPDFT